MTRNRLTALSTFTARCAVVICVSLSRTIWPEPSGTLAARRPDTPSRSATCLTIGPRLSTTSPEEFVSRGPSGLSSSTRTSAAWAVRLMSSHAVLRLRRREEGVDRPCAPVLDRGRDHGRRALRLLGQLRLERAREIDLLVERVVDLDRERRPDLVVGEQLARRLRPGVRVEQLPLRPERERRDEHEQARDDHERPDDERPTPAQRLRHLVGHG